MGDTSEEELIDEYDECPSGRVKDLVHKSHSDPGNRNASARQPRHPLPTGPTTRKCVLTLDGYSYVIGKKYLFIQNRMTFYTKYLIKIAASMSKTLPKMLDAPSVTTIAS